MVPEANGETLLEGINKAKMLLLPPTYFLMEHLLAQVVEAQHMMEELSQILLPMVKIRIQQMKIIPIKFLVEPLEQPQELLEFLRNYMKPMAI